MTVVEANLPYLDELADLALQLWPDNDRSLLRDEFAELLKSDKDKVYLALIDNIPVGFIQMSLRHDYVEGSDSSPVGYVEGIFVLAQHRNKGISRALLGCGEQWAKSLGCTQVASDVELHNCGSQQFHEKVGFTEVNRLVAFIKNI